MRILTGQDVSTILRKLSKEDAIALRESLTSALITYTEQWPRHRSQKDLHQPLRTVIETKDKNTTLIMPVSDTKTTAVKVATVPGRGDIEGAITLYSAVGKLRGVLNAAEITAFRTALATMTVLARWKVPKTPEIMVFGAGKQAEWHIRLALLLIPGIRSITVCNRTPERLQKFGQNVLDALQDHYVDIEFDRILLGAKNMSAYLSDADIVFCCTPSTEPLFKAEQLFKTQKERGRFVSLIGSYKPYMQEVDTETIRVASCIVVDSRAACLEEAGELIEAKLGDYDVVEAGELFRDGLDGRLQGNNSLSIFKCVGFALMDLCLAQELLKIAESRDLGAVINHF